jgi:hypothetical protein
MNHPDTRRMSFLQRCVAALCLLSAVASAEELHGTPIDDALTAVGQEYAILCNTCATPAQFSAKAIATYPRVRNSVAYVYSLARGEVRAVVLDYDPETGAQIGGYEIGVDPRLATYVREAGNMYRQNGNSLKFDLVVRGDGSIYWRRADGSKVELRGAGLNATAAVPKDGVTMPGVNSPIDLRGYVFPPDFNNQYPNFPPTSYDLAFGRAGTIDAFVRDQVNSLPNGGVSGIFNGTVQSNGNFSAMSFVSGGQQVTKQITTQVSVIVPMRDGGYAIVTYNVQTGAVQLLYLYDAQHMPLPLGGGAAGPFLSQMPLRFSNTAAGLQGLTALQAWAARFGIPITGAGGSTGSIVRCHSPTANEVTCTIQPH